MLEVFYPDRLEESAYGIDYEALYEKGYRGIIYDVDNTLVEHGAPATARAKALFERLHGIGFSAVLLSNNKEPRVKSFAREVRYADYIFKAGKPSQLFTDVWGAKNAGIYSILVRPIHPREEIQIVLKRQLEKIVLYFYRRKQKREEEDGCRGY